MTPPLLQKVRGIKETLDEGKRGLKLNIHVDVWQNQYNIVK